MSENYTCFRAKLSEAAAEGLERKFKSEFGIHPNFPLVSLNKLKKQYNASDTFPGKIVKNGNILAHPASDCSK
jgi:hypothetical protein